MHGKIWGISFALIYLFLFREAQTGQARAGGRARSPRDCLNDDESDDTRNRKRERRAELPRQRRSGRWKVTFICGFEVSKSNFGAGNFDVSEE